MNVPKIVSLFCFIFFVCVGANCNAQVPWVSIVKVTTPSGGTGSGFVVATKNGVAEIWTNAHVTGKINSRSRIEWGATGATSEGRVIFSRLDRRRGIDAAKLLAPIPISARVSPVPVGACDWGFDVGDTGGWPLGVRLSSHRIRRTNEETSIGVSYVPAAVPGESGSCVTNEKGEAVGVVTWTMGSRRKFGVFQPIENWTGEPSTRPNTVESNSNVLVSKVPNASSKK